MRRVRYSLVLSLGLLLLGPWAFAQSTATKPLRVVVSFSVLKDLVELIGQDQVAVQSLVAVGEDPHHFEPQPRDIEMVRAADLIFINGLGFEPWFSRLSKSSKASAKVIVVSAGIKVREGLFHGHHEIDPHAWNSPEKLKQYVDVIFKRLSTERPSSLGIFKNRADELVKNLEMIQQEFKEKFSKIPTKHKVILTTHDAAFYLCDEFGIEAFSPGGLTTSQEIRTQDFVRILQVIEARKIRTVFLEKGHFQVLSQKLSNKTKLKLASPLYLDGLSGVEGPAGTVLRMIRHNLGEIYLALSGANQ
jgi:zinc/manganese transport system substrate-binding protein